MPHNDPPLKDLLDLAISAAHAGGQHALTYFNTGVEVESKSDASPVTCADREAELLIRDLIAKHFPTHAILGEEFGGSASQPADYRWIIDPIDGTKSFIHGVPLWGTLIGVEVHGRPVVGVVYIPALDEIISAAQGQGCTWNNHPAHVSKITTIEEATLLTTGHTKTTSRSDAFDILNTRAKSTRTWGDCYGHILVATGRAEIMLDPQMHPALRPLLPILQESGGHFTDWQDIPTIWSPDAVSTNAALHAEVLQILKNERRR